MNSEVRFICGWHIIFFKYMKMCRCWVILSILRFICLHSDWNTSDSANAGNNSRVNELISSCTSMKRLILITQFRTGFCRSKKFCTSGSVSRVCFCPSTCCPESCKRKGYDLPVRRIGTEIQSGPVRSLVSDRSRTDLGPDQFDGAQIFRLDAIDFNVSSENCRNRSHPRDFWAVWSSAKIWTK